MRALSPALTSMRERWSLMAGCTTGGFHRLLMLYHAINVMRFDSFEDGHCCASERLCCSGRLYAVETTDRSPFLGTQTRASEILI
jgi:hypothetical protein